MLWFVMVYTSENTHTFIRVAGNKQLTRLWLVKAGVVAGEAI